ncbi:galactose ABC transporter substrate-binding protein [Succinatimonas hippei]|uniref:D-galactose/methyl-galactoside binding periplasmic protein MglB n=1 Tax=Succinatimonas hippei (strain DSM 22608 / JCM 16073 / KCTC 15190 / YIT 12066) TaxID=762983 RepID=E8LN41_SUCHY|nr:galactose ABC transporter substrate-binding protein [Succinatimonas hippei]EFY06102.1 hypothetical protein HMPREF9444_02194 [Succinatimonas hippei YIT 12066]
MKVNNALKVTVVCSQLLLASSVFAAESKSADVFYYNLTDSFIANLDKILTQEGSEQGINLKKYNAADDAYAQSETLDIALADKKNTPLLINLVDSSYAGEFLASLPKDTTRQIIFFNRNVSDAVLASYDNAWFVGTSPRESGRYQAEILVSYLKAHPDYDKNKNGVLDLVMLKGEQTHLDAVLRTQEVLKVLNEQGIKYKVVFSANANWQFQKGFDFMDQAVSSLTFNNIEAVVCNNDAMAMGAITDLNQYGYNLEDANKYIPVLGIDAIPEARKAVEEGRMLGTVCNDATKLSEVLVTMVKLDTKDSEEISKAIGLPVLDKRISIPYHKICNAQ